MLLLIKLKHYFRSFRGGFTLIELLLVISIIGVISGVMVTTINVQKQKDIAREGVIQDNLQKVAEVVESYRVLEGEYPVACGSDPTTCTGNDALSQLIAVWPSDIEYVAESDQSDFAVYSSALVTDAKYYKYSSDWVISDSDDNSLRECGEEGKDVVGECSPVGTLADDTSPTLVGILLSPSSPTTSITIGNTLQFSAMGLFSDGSHSVLAGTPTWSTLNSNASVNSSGLVTGVTVGTSRVSASLNGIVGSSNFIVSLLGGSTAPPTPDAVLVTAVSGTTTIDVGNSIQVNSCFSQAGGPCTDVTLNAATEWRSSDQSILSVTRTLSAVTITGVSSGTAYVESTYNGVTGRLLITVNVGTQSRVPTRLVILPSGNPVSIQMGSALAFVTRVYYSDGTSSLVTEYTEWEILTGATYIRLSEAVMGMVSGVAIGNASVGAYYSENGVTLNASVNINVITATTPVLSCINNAQCATYPCSSGVPICNTVIRQCVCRTSR